MKFSLSLINKISVIIMFLLDTCFFYLVSTNGILVRIWGNYGKFLLVSFLCVLLFVNIFVTRKVTIKKRFIDIYLIFNILIYILLFIFSYVTYPGQKIYNILFSSAHYLMPWFSLPLLYIFKKEHGIDNTFKILNVLSFILYCVILLQFLIYNWTGIKFLSLTIGLRNDNIRLSLGAIGNIIIIYNYWFVRHNKKNLFNLINLIFGLFCMFVIQQTRAYYIVFSISILVMELLIGKRKHKILKNIIIIGVVSIILTFSTTVNSFINSFEEYDTTTIRLEAIEYFFNAFLKNPLFGHGFIVNEEYYHIATGVLNKYFYSDVGIFGLLGQIGIMAFFILLILYIRWIHIIRNLNDKKIKILLTGLLIASLLMGFSLSIFNQERVILVPLLIAVFEYFYINRNYNNIPIKTE